MVSQSGKNPLRRRGAGTAGWVSFPNTCGELVESVGKRLATKELKKRRDPEHHVVP
jgi:hypothetical protein